MAVKKTSATAPLTFDIGGKLLDKIETLQKRSGATSKSEVIRFDLKEFDFTSVQIEPKSSKQISVRLSNKAKAELLRASKKLKVSVGELLRLSVEALPKRMAINKALSILVPILEVFLPNMESFPKRTITSLGLFLLLNLCMMTMGSQVL